MAQRDITDGYIAASGTVGERTAKYAVARHGPLVVLLYLLGVTAMALVGILSPLALRITAALGAPRESIGLTIALFSLPAAVTATFGGSVVDRFGPRPALIAAALILAAADLLLIAAPTLWLFDAGMVMAGCGFVSIVVAVPATMTAALDGATRTRAMAFWSTFSPTGFSIGLLLAAPFTTTLDWHWAIGIHAALMLALTLAASLLLPDVGTQAGIAGGRPAEKLVDLFAAARDPAARRLALAMAMPNMISYGTSLVAVTYLAKVHGVSLAASAATVAIAKIAAMLLGGTIVGTLLTRDVAPRRLFVSVMAVGIAAQLLLYLPASPFPLAVAGLMTWLFAFGGLNGVCMAMIPLLASERARGGAIAGLVNQAISIGSFLTPAMYFALPGWLGFVTLAIIGLLISVTALPAPPATAPAMP